MRNIIILCISFCGLISWSNNNDSNLLTHQEALVGIAKLSGFFDRTISEDYTLHNITYLLSYHGITINLFKTWKDDPFYEKDMARILGQIYILHQGEAEKKHSQISLPDQYENWVEFCDVHGLDYQQVYRSLLEFFYYKKMVVCNDLSIINMLYVSLA